MTRKSNSRRIAGSILMTIGVALLLAACAWFGRQQAQGGELRARLEQTPAAAPASSPAALAVPTAIATAIPLPTSTASSQATPIPQPVGVTPTALPIAPVPVLPVRIVIPDLELDAGVVEMGWDVVNTAAGPQSEWVIPKNEAGHHINSAALNRPGNIVISGHNNIEGKVFEAISLAWDDKTKTRVDDFTDRSEILKGRTIRLYDSAGKAFEYTISDFFRLKDTGVSLAQRIQNARFMAPTDDSRLTLVTCWPPWSNTHRLIVVAVPSQP